MHSFRESSESTRFEPSVKISFPVKAALVAGTLPLLAVVVSGRLLSEGVVELGKASEELFRGDRLPIRPLMRSVSQKS